MTSPFDTDLLGFSRSIAAEGGAGSRIGPGESLGDDMMPEADSSFISAVGQALLAEGIDITMLSGDQIAALVQMLWRTDHLRNLFDLQNDPSVAGFGDIVVPVGQLRNAIRKELFDPTASSSGAAVQAGLAIKEQQGLKLSQPEQEYLVSGAGGSSDIRQIIIEEAGKLGVDPALALAIAQQESGLNPNAVGDGGHSVGLFQLHDEGEGAGMGDARYDPRINAARALSEVAQVAAQHPDWSPGEIAAAAQRPADRAGYAAAVDSLYGPIKGGKLPSTSSKTTTLRQLYPEAVSRFRGQYGRDPSAAELRGLVGLNTDQIEEYLRNQQSHIPGLTFGAMRDLRSIADKESMSMFGHGVTDGMLKEIHDQGKTSPASVRFYLQQQDIAGKMDPQTYEALHQLNQPHMQGIYNQTGFNSRIAFAQYQRAKDAGITDAQIQAARRRSVAAQAVRQERQERADLPRPVTEAELEATGR